MALCGCSPGRVFIAAVLALVLLPAQYLVPDLQQKEEILEDQVDQWFNLNLQDIPAFDLFLVGVLVMMVVFICMGECIERKILERKMCKLNQYITLSIDRLRIMDAHHKELEATLKMVHNATTEYDLFLYLLLREQRILAHNGPPSNCFFDKTLDNDIDKLSLS